MKKEFKNGSNEPTFTKTYNNLYKLNVISYQPNEKTGKSKKVNTLNASDILILSILISYFENVDDVYISDKTISDHTNNFIGIDNVKSIIKKLNTLGLLNKVTIPNQNNGGKTRFLDIPDNVMKNIYGDTYIRKENSGKKYNYYKNNTPESLPIEKIKKEEPMITEVGTNRLKEMGHFNDKEVPTPIQKEVSTPVVIEDEISKDEIIELFEKLIPNRNGKGLFNHITKYGSDFNKVNNLNKVVNEIDKNRRFIKTMKDSNLDDSGINEIIEQIKVYEKSEPIEIINSTPEPEIITTPVELKKDVKVGTIDDLFKLFEKKDKNEILLDDLVDVEMMNEYTNQDDDVNEKLPWDN